MVTGNPGCRAHPAANITSVSQWRCANGTCDRYHAVAGGGQKRLGTVDAYKGGVEGYARQGMLPVDLEHMMTNEAAELNMRAQAIERLSPTETVALQLRNRANELSRAGRTLRIDVNPEQQDPDRGLSGLSA